MERFKRRWRNIPATIRKPIVLVVGMLFVIVSPFTGVLPGPGGIPIFLIGVAILSTEYAWARRLREWTLHRVQIASDAWKRHKILGSLLILICIALAVSGSIFGMRFIKSHI